MFDTTAYSAFFTYIGLHLHSTAIDIITSQKFFIAILIFIFGASFIFTGFKFASKYVPGSLVQKQSVPLSAFVKIVFSLFIGISLLKVDSEVGVSKFDNSSWHSNPYLLGKLPDIEDKYKVSYIFKLLSRSAEELSRFAVVTVDKIFATTNSQVTAPDFFYKAMIVAGTATIEDEGLRSRVHLYTNACFQQVIPSAVEYADRDIISKFFTDGSEIDDKLRKIPLRGQNGDSDCLTLKREIVADMRSIAQQKAGPVLLNDSIDIARYHIDKETFLNKWAAGALANYYLEATRGPSGLHKGSMLPSSITTFFQWWHTSFWSKALNFVGLGSYSGAVMAGERAVKFSEMLQRAPMIQGITKMILIFIFPLMIFWVVSGRWKVLIFWFALYTSVLLWQPIWTFFYHIMTSIAMSADVMAEFGKLSDGISLYGSKIITNKLYTFYALYSWIQILSGPLPTTMLGFFLSPLLKDTEQEGTPEVVATVKNIGMGVATGGPGGGAMAAVGSIKSGK